MTWTLPAVSDTDVSWCRILQAATFIGQRILYEQGKIGGIHCSVYNSDQTVSEEIPVFPIGESGGDPLRFFLELEQRPAAIAVYHKGACFIIRFIQDR